MLFLRKLVPGGSQHSFGIHVARMAGMPRKIVERASEILEQLEKKFIEDHVEGGSAEIAVQRPATKQVSNETVQLSIFETVDPLAGKLRSALKALDIHSMTPIECMLRLNEFKKLVEDEE